MRRVILSIISLFICSYLKGQLGVWVRTDKSLYNYGDSVHITVQAYNSTAGTGSICFPNGCQASFSIDNYDYKNHLVCIQVPTCTNPLPNDSSRWHFTYPKYGQQALSIGSHRVIGEVLHYGVLSQPVYITVTPSTNTENYEMRSGGFLLNQNFPNPFDRETYISFVLESSCKVTIDIFNSLGLLVRRIINDYYPAGSHSFIINLNDLACGVYWCRLETKGKSQAIKLLKY